MKTLLDVNRESNIVWEAITLVQLDDTFSDGRFRVIRKSDMTLSLPCGFLLTVF